jgi:hypothetical protein
LKGEQMKQHIFTAILFAAFASSIAHADVVDFTQVSIGPQATIHFQGVTITGGAPNPDLPVSQVGMVAGVGLGIGPDGSVDFTFSRSYDETGAYGATAVSDGQFNISVDGRINSITLATYMIIDGPPVPNGVSADFFFHYNPQFIGLTGGDYFQGAFYGTTSKVINFPTCSTGLPGSPDCRPVALNNIFLLGPEFADSLRAYEVATNFPEYTEHFGFSITSIDYERTHVPEPSSLLLLSCGIAGLAVARRKFRK